MTIPHFLSWVVYGLEELNLDDNAMARYSSNPDLINMIQN